jgi:hypothetical protein
MRIVGSGSLAKSPLGELPYQYGLHIARQFTSGISADRMIHQLQTKNATGINHALPEGIAIRVQD